MWLIAIEVMGAFFLFAFIIWWTMFPSKKTKKSSKSNQPIPKKSEPSEKTDSAL